MYQYDNLEDKGLPEGGEGSIAKMTRKLLSYPSLVRESRRKSLANAEISIQTAQPLQSLIDLGLLQVRANGLIVFVPKYGIEGPVYLSSKESSSAKEKDADLILDEELQTLKSRNGDWSYTVSLTLSQRSSTRGCVNSSK